MMNYNIKAFQVDNAKQAYSKLATILNTEGKLIESRGEKTLEVLNVAVEIENPRDRIVPIMNFNNGFILREAYDILNSNDPRSIHSKQMLEKTMGDSNDPMFFGNELRQSFSRWSFKKILDRFIKDKNTRKAVLNLGNRRNTKHTPCMLFAHFIIRDNKLHMTVETRATAVSMGFINDVYLMTLMQEILLGWIKEYYPEVEMGTFLYKTISLHTYVEEKDTLSKFEPLWSQSFSRELKEEYPFSLTYKDYIKEMGILYHYVDVYMKAESNDDIDNGKYITYNDIGFPDRSLFSTQFFYNWARIIYNDIKK